MRIEERDRGRRERLGEVMEGIGRRVECVIGGEWRVDRDEEGVRVMIRDNGREEGLLNRIRRE